MNNGPEWFAPKGHGYGSGLPIAWQGWAVLIGYLALVFALTPLASRSLLTHFSLVMALTAGLVVICRKTTRGGWRWRWGDKD